MSTYRDPGLDPAPPHCHPPLPPPPPPQPPILTHHHHHSLSPRTTHHTTHHHYISTSSLINHSTPTFHSLTHPPSHPHTLLLSFSLLPNSTSRHVRRAWGQPPGPQEAVPQLKGGRHRPPPNPRITPTTHPSATTIPSTLAPSSRSNQETTSPSQQCNALSSRRRPKASAATSARYSYRTNRCFPTPWRRTTSASSTAPVARPSRSTTRSHPNTRRNPSNGRGWRIRR